MIAILFLKFLKYNDRYPIRINLKNTTNLANEGEILVADTADISRFLSIHFRNPRSSYKDLMPVITGTDGANYKDAQFYY